MDKPVVLKSDGGMSIRVVKLAEGLSHPDGLVFLPDGHTMLVTERPGRLRVVKDGVLDPTPVAGLPAMSHIALAGLQDIVLHPDFAKNHLLYISYSKDREPQPGVTVAIARARYDQGRLTDVKDILVTEAWESPLGTYGGRMVFGPDGMLYIAVGDRDGTTHNDVSSARPQAQSLASHIGKILRVRDDGSIPPDNPFVKTPNAKGEIYSYGHRNVYGLAWDPKTGQMWTSEFGPAGGDEINKELPGHNYGWPLVSMGAALLRPPGLRSALVPRGHGQSDVLLEPELQPREHDLLHRRQVPAPEGRPAGGGRVEEDRAHGHQRGLRHPGRPDAARAERPLPRHRPGPRRLHLRAHRGPAARAQGYRRHVAQARTGRRRGGPRRGGRGGGAGFAGLTPIGGAARHPRRSPSIDNLDLRNGRRGAASAGCHAPRSRRKPTRQASGQDLECKCGI
ncbi:MAG: PQQ-dependent sugar dehydrogenase [Caulobacteraceae bacterium]